MFCILRGIWSFLDIFDHSRMQRVAAEHEPNLPSIIAFQISTNASIRRALNRAISVIYDTKEQYRMARPNYAAWLIRITGDLWAHYSAVYQNLPDFLLTSSTDNTSPAAAGSFSPSTPNFIRSTELGSNPWNVIRLKGRYYAGLYFIHRHLIEFVVLNPATFDSNPSRIEVLEKCRLCLDGCRGFIRVFDVDPANSVTCLFPSGMV